MDDGEQDGNDDGEQDGNKDRMCATCCCVTILGTRPPWWPSASNAAGISQQPVEVVRCCVGIDPYAAARLMRPW